MKPTKTKKHPSNKPITVNEDVWFYEAEKSLEFVVWVTGRDGNEVCKTFRVQWSKLANTFPGRAALTPDTETK